jgi:tetratricopeptide (TPR) repeat protein
MRRLPIAGLAVAGALAVTPACADDGSICYSENSSPDAMVAACSRLIASGRLKGQTLANTYSWRLSAFMKKADLDRALSDADMWLRLSPADANAHAARAQVWIAKRDYDRAIRDSDEAIRLNPKSVDGYNNRGFAKHQKQDFDGAVVDYDQAIRINPKSANLYSNRGNSWQEKQEFDRAIADHNRAVALSPRVAAIYVNRAGAFRLSGNYDKALADYAKAISLDPNFANPYIGRGLVYRATNNLAGAMAEYSRAIALNPNLAGAYTSRGLLHEANGDYDSARRDFRTALDLAAGRMLGISKSATLVDITSRREHEIARARLAVLAESDASAAPKPQAPAAPPVAASAPTPGDSERRVALVIGNGAYANAPALANPVNDARALARNLRAMGFKVFDGFDLDRAAMQRMMAEFLRNAVTARMAVVFYAGHGIQIDGKNYLLPIDARIENGAELTTDMTDLDTILTGLDDQIRTNIVILDACRDNPLAKNVTRVAAASRSVTVRSGLAAPSGLGKGATLGAGTLLAFATAPGQVALDGDGENSPFSAALSRHISTPGLEVQQMLTRARAEVVAATKGQQVPWSNSSLLGEVYLVGKP